MSEQEHMHAHTVQAIKREFLFDEQNEASTTKWKQNTQAEDTQRTS